MAAELRTKLREMKQSYKYFQPKFEEQPTFDSTQAEILQSSMIEDYFTQPEESFSFMDDPKHVVPKKYNPKKFKNVHQSK